MSMLNSKLLQKIAFGKYLGKYLSIGNGKSDAKVEIYYKDIDPFLAEKYLIYKHKEANSDGRPGYVSELLSSEKGVFIIRRIATELQFFDVEYHDMFRWAIPIYSKEIFDGRPVEFILTDEKYNDKRRIALTDTPFSEPRSEAITVSAQATPVTANEINDLMSAANELQQTGKYKEAIAQYSKLLEIDPENSNAIVNRGICFYSDGEFEASIAAFNSALNLPGMAEDACKYYLGMSYFNLNKFKEAVPYLQKAIELERAGEGLKDWWDASLLGIAYTSLVSSQVNTKAYSDLIATATNGLMIDFNDLQRAGMLISRGVGFYFAGNFEGSVDDITAAIKLKPDDLHMVYMLRGLSWIETGNYEKALSDCLKAEMLHPEPVPEVLGVKGLANYYLKNSMLEEIDNALKQFPGDGFLLYAKGRILIGEGDILAGKAHLELAVDLDSTEAEMFLVGLKNDGI